MWTVQAESGRRRGAVPAGAPSHVCAGGAAPTRRATGGLQEGPGIREVGDRGQKSKGSEMNRNLPKNSPDG